MSVRVLHQDNPAPRVLAHYRHFAAQLVQRGQTGHAGISVDIAGFRRYQGDWVGAVVTPWFIHLLLLPGGGTLWREVAAGERLRVGFPAGDLEFVVEHNADADLPAHAFVTVLAPLDTLADQEAAQDSAMQAMRLIFEPPADTASGQSGPTGVEQKAEQYGDVNDKSTRAPLGRRGFFRRLAGRR